LNLNNFNNNNNNNNKKIINYIETIVSNNPDIARSYNAGRTYQKRDLKVMVLKTPTSKKLVWIDCGIHAREWVFFNY
jgi:hypothetical protein